MYKKYLRPVLAGSIVILTVGVFAWYVSKHPEIINQLTRTPPGTIAAVLGLYVVFMGCLAWIQRATLELCDIKLGRKESLLLMSYSSIINFFGPLQSGPAFRAAYLKRKHNVRLKQYGVATLMYYGFYALFSALFIAAYFIGIWALVLIILTVAIVPILLRSAAIVRLIPARFRNLKLASIGHLAAATLAQVTTLAVIFYIELNAIAEETVSVLSTLIYTGAANFALFVSITPGAIGFREAFLVFTQSLHGIANSVIVGANLIDRSVYIVFLGLLSIFVFGLHAGDLLKKK